MSKIKAATICLNSTPDRHKNIQQAFALMQDCISREKPDWILLPEVFTYIGIEALAPELCEHEQSELLKQLSAFACQHSVQIFAGSVHERPTRADDKPFNTMFVLDRDGSIVGKYRKNYLFELKHPQGKVVIDETLRFQPAKERLTLNIDGFVCAHAICYDLRFSPLFESYYSDRPFDVLVIPAAFTKRTGQAHWHALLKARAIEYQCYVIAANQCGTHAPGRMSSGHSLIIDPWGDILVDTGDQPGYVCATLDPQRISEVRRQIPCGLSRSQKESLRS